MQGSFRTISSQANYGSQIHLSNTNLNFHEILCIKNDTALMINKMCVFTDYMTHLKLQCSVISFNLEAAKAYAFRPKMLAHRLYKNVELYSLILRLNHMKSVSDFTEERLQQGIWLPTQDISTFLNEVLIKEKNPIDRNLSKMSSDTRAISQSS